MSPLLSLLTLSLLLSCGVHGVPGNATDVISLNPWTSFLWDSIFSIPLTLGSVAFDQLSFICAKIIDNKIFMPVVEPEINSMNFILHADACSSYSVPLTRPRELWSLHRFSHSKQTVIFITGWTTTINDNNSGPLVKAFACRGDYNVIVLDAANFVKTLYSWSSLNTDSIGQYLAIALLQLPTDYATQRVHLIGHSLGAQIAGSAGRHYSRLTGGRQIARVTGLDPANPCFYDGKTLPGLSSRDANYVDIIHSNPAYLGTAAQVGHADFYVEGLSAIKTGCSRIENGILSCPTVCSHQRAVDYLVESVYPNNTDNFRARFCSKFEYLKNGRGCATEGMYLMGLQASAHGIFYVDVNAKEPYGKNARWNRVLSTQNTCGVCPWSS